MAVQPDTDERLDRTGKRLSKNGVKLLALGATLYLIGALLLLLDVTQVGGLMCIGLATPPTLGAIALLISGGTSRHAAKQRPFA